MKFLVLFLPIYGISIMIALLNIKRSDFTKSKVLKLFLLCLLTLILNIYVYSKLGQEIYSQYYLLWVQFPTYLAFSLFSQYKGFKLLFVLLSAIALSSIPVFIVIIIRIITNSNVFFIFISCIISYTLMLLFILKFMRPNFHFILEYGKSITFLKLSTIPILYYIYGYFNTGYTFTQYTILDNFILKSIPDIIIFIFYFLLIDIFKEFKEKQIANNEKALLSSQIDEAAKQIEILRAVQKQTSIYRHDMRHHFSLIYGYLLAGDSKKAQNYLELIQTDIDGITPTQYCENNSVNLILANFASKAKRLNVLLKIDISLPKTIFIPETELCALLSNALENAIHAAAKIEDNHLRKVTLNCKIHNNRLLLSIENNFKGTVEIKGGKPISKQKDHGIGTKSIVSIVSKRNGYVTFKTIDQTFILKVIIPLQNNKTNE